MNKEQTSLNLTANEEKILKVLYNLAHDLESTAINIRQELFDLLKVNDEPTWIPDRIKWENTEGHSGLYERSKDLNNPEFKALLKDLATHQGKLMRDGYFYWTFHNGATVGRKKRGAGERSGE